MTWRFAGVLLGVVLAVACRGSDPNHTGDATASRLEPVRARLVAVSAEVARDGRTGLRWTRHDGGRDYGWHDAERHCRALSLGGHSDWRLPGIDELQPLYDPHLDQPCGERTCHLDPAVQLTGPYVWSGTARSSDRRIYLDFQFGTVLGPRLRPGLVRRVLCVRGPVS